MTPEREQKLINVLNKRQADLTVVLENVQDPHNISAVMRTCDSVGIQDIYILNTKIPRHKKWGFKSSSSAAKWLSVHQYDNAAACFEIIKKNYQNIYATYLSGDAKSLYEIDFTQSIALVFGNEHTGISEEVLPFTNGNFMIPQSGIIQSLNISVACAVSLYEAYRQKQIVGHYQQSSMPAERMQQLMQQWSYGTRLEEE